MVIRLLRWIGILAIAVIVALILLILSLLAHPNVPPNSSTSTRVPVFSHVVLIMMENKSPVALSNPSVAPYIHWLQGHSLSATNAYGVTHPSLPNYVAMLSGRTGRSFSDNPNQQFSFPTLVSQLNAHHISWEGVMQSLPYPGYLGNWYPEPAGQNPVFAPVGTLYAKKHNPFLLFPAIAHQYRNRVVPLRTLRQQLASGTLPQFTWLTPNLCNDMHGQPSGTTSTCPESHMTALIRQGSRFLATWVPRIEHSKSWNRHSVIFIVWDEGGGFNLQSWTGLKSFLSAAPGSPPLWPTIPALGLVGGGRTPLFILYDNHRGTFSTPVNNYSVLKTIEASWHLGFLGGAKDPAVSVIPLSGRPKP